MEGERANLEIKIDIAKKERKKCKLVCKHKSQAS